MSARPTQSDGRVHGVVIAIRRPSDGKYLIIRRSATVVAPLKVCFPGGAVEAGESYESAVVREAREEVGVDVKPLRHVWTWHSPDKPLTLFGWLAEPLSDLAAVRPDPAEVAEILWMSPEEVPSHPDALATNASFCACLVDASKPC
jgi:mutator protein MutT